VASDESADLGEVVTRIVSSYNTVFFWCVPLMALALVLALRLEEKPLSDEMLAVAAGDVDVPEY
jgi:hypothetical protein